MRATNWDELMGLMDVMFANEEQNYRSFVAQPDDIVISPFAKSGTTWLQQLTHQLRTGGHTDFEDIYDVVPFLDVAADIGIDVNGPQVTSPRLFKSHGTWEEVPRGCRYIVSIRDPVDAATSFYRFMSGWLLEPGSMSIDELHQRRSFDRVGGGRYWRHLASWLRHRDDPAVLLVTFEGMKRDLRRVATAVARFGGMPHDHVDVAVELSSAGWMAANAEPFSEPRLRKRIEALAGVPSSSDASKVPSGRETRPTFSRASLDEFDRIWAETIAEEFGYETYDALEADIDGALD